MATSHDPLINDSAQSADKKCLTVGASTGVVGGAVFVAGIIIVIALTSGSSNGGGSDSIGEGPYLQRYALNSDADLHCQDGSNPNYYIKQAGLSDKWIIFLDHAGAFCFDKITCDYRALVDETYVTSDYDQDQVLRDGVLSNEIDQNPYFYDYNILMLTYCSSDYFFGTSTYVDNSTQEVYYFQGALYIEAVLAEVMEEDLFANATSILLWGHGGGGYGLLTQADYIKGYLSALPTRVTDGIKAVIDTAWYADQADSFDGMTCLDNVNSTNCPLHEAASYAVENWEPLYPVRCSTQGLTWECLIASLSNIGEAQVPLFIFEWGFEQSQLSTLGVDLVEYENQTAFAEDIAELRVQEFRLLSDESAWLSPFCWDHQLSDKDYSTVRGIIEDVSFPQAVFEWATGNEVPRLEDEICGNMSCNPTCGATL